MPYLVQARVEKPGCGTFKTQAETKRAAIEKAQGLRAHGLVVEIIDPKGEPVDETRREPELDHSWPPAAA